MQAATGPEYSGCDVTGCYPVCRQTQTIVFITMASLVSPSRKRPSTGINCIAPGCTKYYGKDNTVHYHLVSVDRIQAQEWLNKLKIARPPNKAGVCQSCSNHFSDDQYESRVYFFYANRKFVLEKRSKLKKTAVLTLIDFSGYPMGSTDGPTVYSPVVSARWKRQIKRSEKKETRDLNARFQS